MALQHLTWPSTIALPAETETLLQQEPFALPAPENIGEGDERWSRFPLLLLCQLLGIVCVWQWN